MAVTWVSEGDADSAMRVAMLERWTMKRRVRLQWVEKRKGSGKKWPRVVWGLQQLLRSSASREISDGL
ncbi:hypothetical protein GW17_00061975 [Ensete ventricosum]|nr:hypothetical protein GW17_00061975 [Ensete ventricosum]